MIASNDPEMEKSKGSAPEGALDLAERFVGPNQLAAAHPAWSDAPIKDGARCRI